MDDLERKFQDARAPEANAAEKFDAPAASKETTPGAMFTPKSAQALAALERLSQENELEQIRDALFVTKQVTYVWTVEDDVLTWSENLSEVLRGIDVAQANTGRGFASLLDRDNKQTRYDTVVGSKAVDAGDGIGYCIEYRIWPSGVGQGQPFWVEDTGHWYAGDGGKPAYALGTVRVIDERRIRDDKLNYLSERDPLTGFMNRVKLTSELMVAVRNAERSGDSYGFVLAAMDNLDVVNDAYGFEVADQVISAVGKRLKSAMRGDDLIGRYAGNKFGLILHNCSEYDIAVAAERFLDVVRGSVIKTEKGPVWATISLGGCLMAKYAKSVQEVMVRAEEALADAKRRPTDCFVQYKPSKRRASVRERNVSCAAEIVSALKQNQFVLAFQPIIDSRTREVHMYEGLLRLLGEDDKALSAGHLLPVAEKLGLIRLIDRRVLEMGIATLEENPDLYLSLNISGITATDARWFEQIVDYISQHSAVAERLTLEITETVALFDLEEIVRFVARLRELGCRVAIDDFGAGYTSFRNLQLLNVDIVKLDGSFCESLSESPDNQYFVQTLVGMANRFDLEIVAEWVQSEEDARLLESWGVTLLQGNHFGEATLTPVWGGMGKPGPSVEHAIDPLAVREEPAPLNEQRVVAAGDIQETSGESAPPVFDDSERAQKATAAAVTAETLLAPFRAAETDDMAPREEGIAPQEADESFEEADALESVTFIKVPENAPESLFTSSRKRQIPEADEQSSFGGEPAAIASDEDDGSPQTLQGEDPASPLKPAEDRAEARPVAAGDNKAELLNKLNKAFGSAGSFFSKNNNKEG